MNCHGGGNRFAARTKFPAERALPAERAPAERVPGERAHVSVLGGIAASATWLVRMDPSRSLESPPMFHVKHRRLPRSHAPHLELHKLRSAVLSTESCHRCTLVLVPRPRRLAPSSQRRRGMPCRVSSSHAVPRLRQHGRHVTYNGVWSVGCTGWNGPVPSSALRRSRRALARRGCEPAVLAVVVELGIEATPSDCEHRWDVTLAEPPGTTARSADPMSMVGASDGWSNRERVENR